MPDEPITTAGEGAESGAAAPPPDVDAAESAAAEQHFDRVTTGRRAGAAAGEPAPAKEPPKRRSAQEISPQFAERISRGARLRQLEQQHEAAQKQLKVYADLFQGILSDAEAAGQAEDPEPNFEEQPKAWYAWQFRQSQRAFEEKLKPLEEFVSGQSKHFETAQQQQQREQQVRAQRAELAGLMAEAEQEYIGTPEGAGYPQRLLAFAQKLQGHYMRFSQADPARGLSREQAAGAMVAQHLDGMVQLALARGWNPAVYVDAEAEAWGITGTPKTGQPGVNGKPAPTRVSKETETARAAAASGLAGGLSTGPAAGSADATVSLRGQKLTPAKIREIVRKDPRGGASRRVTEILKAAGIKP